MDLYTFPPEVGSNALLLPSATAPMIATPYDENHLVVGPLDSGDHDYKHYYYTRSNPILGLSALNPLLSFNLSEVLLRLVTLSITDVGRPVIILTGTYVPWILNLESITGVL